MDITRLARAATLQVRSLSTGAYQVTGGSAPHMVRYGTTGGAHVVWCDCPDFRTGFGVRPCKHILAVAITQATDEDRAEIANLLGIG
jgi:uncharacterized Zn finger protein